jgi:hypothetical protein
MTKFYKQTLCVIVINNVLHRRVASAASLSIRKGSSARLPLRASPTQRRCLLHRARFPFLLPVFGLAMKQKAVAHLRGHLKNFVRPFAWLLFFLLRTGTWHLLLFNSRAHFLQLFYPS